MKRALIDKDTRRSIQVVAVGQEFEVHGNLFWVDCEDNVQDYWILNDDGSFTDPHADRRDEFGNQVEPWHMQRGRAYAPVASQLDMLYRELKEKGSISRDGEWFQHISDVKAAIPKPDGYVYDPNATNQTDEGVAQAYQTQQIQITRGG
jgi:hypothetical protein